MWRYALFSVITLLGLASPAIAKGFWFDGELTNSKVQGVFDNKRGEACIAIRQKNHRPVYYSGTLVIPRTQSEMDHVLFQVRWKLVDEGGDSYLIPDANFFIKINRASSKNRTGDGEQILSDQDFQSLDERCAMINELEEGMR